MYPLRPAEHVVKRYPNVPFKVLQVNREPVYVAKFNHAGTHILTGGADRTIRLWNVEKNPANDPNVHILERSKGIIGNDGTDLSIYGEDTESLYVCDGQSESYVTSFSQGHSYEVRDLAVSVDGALMVSVGGDRQALVWDVGTASVRHRLSGHTGRVNSVALLSSDVCITGSEDKTVRIWDLRSRRCSQIIGDMTDSCASVAVVGDQVICGSTDGCVYSYDIRAHSKTCDHLGAAVTHVSATSNGEAVIAQTTDSAIAILDGERGGRLATLTGHISTNYPIRCALLNDELVCSGSEDGNIYFWELNGRSCGHLTQPLRHTGPDGTKAAVAGVALSTNERWLASSAHDGVVTLWR